MKKRPDVLAYSQGGTKTVVALTSWCGEVRRFCRFPSNVRDGPKKTQAEIADAIRYVTRGVKSYVVGGAIGAPIDPGSGEIQGSAPLRTWRGINIREFLTRTTQNRPVFLRNDADAAALAQLYFGSAKDLPDPSLLFLTCGTGMGLGPIDKGRLLEGTNWAVGEVAHMTIGGARHLRPADPLTFEETSCGSAIPTIAKLLWPKQRGKTSLTENPSGEMVSEAARAGDSFARRVMTTMGECLGEGVWNLVTALNPQLVVIGGVYPRCRDLLEGPVMNVVRQLGRRNPLALSAVKIVPDPLGEKLDVLQALAVARYALASECRS